MVNYLIAYESKLHLRVKYSEIEPHQNHSTWHEFTQPDAKFHRAVITFHVISSRVELFASDGN